MNFKKFAFLVATSFLFSSFIQDKFQNNFDTPSEIIMEATSEAFFGRPCPTSVLPIGTGGNNIDVYLNGNLVTTFNSETSFNLSTANKDYFFNIPSGGSVAYCSCGDNLGNLNSGPGAILTTSSNSAPATTCSF